MNIFKSTAFAALISVFTSLSAHAATPIINLSIGGELTPGVYGQVQFGNAPPPPVFYPQPKIVVRQPDAEELEPIYLHVPPGHAKNWAKHCREYNACNRRVYFVKSAEYEPGYRKHGDEGRQDRGRHREERRDEDSRGESDRNDGDDEGNRGHGRGRGRDKD